MNFGVVLQGDVVAGPTAHMGPVAGGVDVGDGGGDEGEAFFFVVFLHVEVEGIVDAVEVEDGGVLGGEGKGAKDVGADGLGGDGGGGLDGERDHLVGFVAG